MWVLKNYDDIAFYAGKSYDFEGLIVASHYKNEDDEAPHFYYIADGLKFYKVWIEMIILFIHIYFFNPFSFSE